MAIVNGGTQHFAKVTGFELFDPYWYDSFISTASEFTFTTTDGSSYLTMLGSGFVANYLDPFTGFITGDVNSFKYVLGGKTVLDVQGFTEQMATVVWQASNNNLLPFLSKDADTITGTAGMDALGGYGGNDTIDAAAGTLDVAIYRGASSDYTVTKNPDGSFQVKDKRDPGVATFDGTDTIKGFEFLKFSDGLYTTGLKLATNVAPAITPGQAFGVAENGQVTGQLDGLDLMNDTLVWHLTGKTVPGLRLTAQGEFTFTANGATYDALKEGQTLKVTFNAQATSEDGRSSKPAAVSITVTGKNDGVEAVNDTAVVAGKALAVQVLKNDTDLDKGDTKTITGVTQGQWATSSIAGATVKYGVDGKLIKIGGGESLTDSFTYTVTDGAGASDTGTVNVTIAGQAANGTAKVTLTAAKADLVTVDVTTLKNAAFDAAATLKAFTTVNGLGMEDALVLVNGAAQFQATVAADYVGLNTVADAANKAASLLGIGMATAFNVGADAYLFIEQDAGDALTAGDGLIKLTGVNAFSFQATPVGDHLSLILI